MKPILVTTSLFFSLCSVALLAQETTISEKGLTPDPDIFDGTFSENWDREQEQIPYARIGETSYGNSLEGKENHVKGWVTEQGDNPEGQGRDPQRQGRGLGQEGEPEDEGSGGGNQEDNSIEVTEQPENPGGGGQSEEQKQQRSGGGNNGMEPPAGMQTAGGGGSNNPLEMLKQITSMAQGKRQSENSPESQQSGEEGEGTFGNNPYQVEIEKQSADVLGANRQETEKPEKNASEHRSAAAGRQEQTENSGSETGNDLPSGI